MQLTALLMQTRRVMAQVAHEAEREHGVPRLALRTQVQRVMPQMVKVAQARPVSPLTVLLTQVPRAMSTRVHVISERQPLTTHTMQAQRVMPQILLPKVPAVSG